jgi:hypothetical protein
MAMRHTPAVAGRFYPAQPQALETEVARLLSSRQEPQPVKAVVSPHTGISYSGAVAGAVYRRIRCPAVFLILGPNHMGVGEPVALMAEGKWEMPLGAVALDRELAAALRGACPLCGMIRSPMPASIPWKCNCPFCRCSVRRVALSRSSRVSSPLRSAKNSAMRWRKLCSVAVVRWLSSPVPT